jgi:predicted DsbA family dithiol-disulfide isomerase
VALSVDVFIDIVCPWCFVGNQRLERVLAESGGPPAAVEHHAFLLDPTTPSEGRDIPTMLRRKYGIDPQEAWARLEAEARKSGLELDLSKQRYNYPTVRAHTLIRRAHAKGTQRALVNDLFRAHFVEARNVNDPEVLADLGTRHGFTTDEVHALVNDAAELAKTETDARAAAASGIQGVPFFVFAERLAVEGAQQEQVLRAAVERAAGLAERDPQQRTG